MANADLGRPLEDNGNATPLTGPLPRHLPPPIYVRGTGLTLREPGERDGVRSTGYSYGGGQSSEGGLEPQRFFVYCTVIKPWMF